MKRSLVAVLGSAFLLASASLGSGALADTKEPVELLFVQNATGMHYADGTLTLEGSSPATVYFSDRPNRMVGSMSNEDFLKVWNKGKDNFSEDPPNAALSLLAEPGLAPVVVELTDIALTDGDLVYKMRVLAGDMPENSGPVSLFIDSEGWGDSLGANVDPATDPEIQLGSGLDPTSGPAFANMSEPEDMQGENPPGEATSRCGTHSLISFNICF